MPLVSLSVVIAIVVSLVAKWFAVRSREETKEASWRKITGALLMGGVFPLRNYTEVAAVFRTR